jgi:hypothetical protein
MTQVLPPPDVASDEARAYQEMLLAALGDDDPADVQAGGPSAWQALIAEAGPDLRTRPEPAEWSVVELLGHAADAEIVMSARYRWVIAQDEPMLVGYDQDAWPPALRHADADPADLLTLFEALRAANVALWRRSGPAERARVGRHLERGPESYSLMFRMLAGHDRVHMEQARRALTTVRSSP